MTSKSAALCVIATLGLSAQQAGATTLTTSFSTFAANAGSSLVNTVTTGEYTPNDPIATVSTANLLNGTVGLSDPFTMVVQPPSGGGGFPFNLSNGFSGDLFLPSGASITLTPPANFSAFGFYTATYSNSAIVPTFAVSNAAVAGSAYVISVTLANGQSQTFTTAGGDLNTGITPAGFFGYYGGSVASLTITDTDPNGFVFGDFYSAVATTSPVPEPGSLSLLMVAGVTALVRARRRAG